MSKHTPGPWKIVDSWEDHTIEGPGGEEIIFQDGPHQTPSIKEANASLIAASPEMFRFLKKIVEAEQERHGYVPAWLDEAQAVIKQVEGETE